MLTQKRHYQIRKYVFCDIINDACTPETDITTTLTPNCKNCNDFIMWKKSGLTIPEYLNKLHEDYLDESMPRWRISR